MRNYCKAYHLRDLRQFSQWSEKPGASDKVLTDEEIVYLWDDMTVVLSPVIPDKGLLFDDVTPEWRDFCHSVLLFSIPEDLRYAYEQSTSEVALAAE
jgi:hypothetical protein